MVAKNFCLMTIGRTGSTSLMQALSLLPGVVLPSRLFPDCDDEELVHPQAVGPRRHTFAQQLGVALPDNASFIKAYYRYFAAHRYVGFKSMPDRHDDYEQFVARPDIFFITLSRRDVPSVVVSFLLAMHQGTWRRQGGPVEKRLTFTTSLLPKTDRVLSYVLAARRALTLIPHAVHLAYEDLCSPDFRDEQLEAFFEHPIRLAAPRVPIAASSYVENWEDFHQFVRLRTAELQGEPVFIL